MSDQAHSDRAFWDRFARYDPLWAILSEPSKAGRAWNLAEFLATGVREISVLMYELQALGLRVQRDAALDFGCGIGRLTQPLAKYFDRVTGVDVSPEMIRLATRVNRTPTIRFVANDRDDLSLFESGIFSFAYSNVVLQHIAPPRAERYLEELLRVVSPGGVVVFQLPSHPRPSESPGPAQVPMAADAYRASLQYEDAIADPLEPGGTMDVTLAVTNVSDVAWSQPDVGSIRVGNHWLDASGHAMLVQDDGRATLPARVEPAQTCVASLAVRAPAEPGVYTLECDVVHEGITWFNDRGSPTCRRQVVIGRAAPAAAHTPTTSDDAQPTRLDLPDLATVSAPGPLPMYGVERGLVTRIIEEHGGALAHVASDERCGPEWVGYRYYVRKNR
jgi:SAM-dependent methyltransferase